MSEENEELSADISQMLIDMMREQYPDIQAYQDGQLLSVQEPPPPEQVPETQLDYVSRDGSNTIIVDVGATANPIFAKYKMVSLEPNISDPNEEDITNDPETGFPVENVSLEQYDDMIDGEFNYFVEEEEPPVIVAEPEIISDVFMAKGDINLADVHDGYISAGPHKLVDGTILNSQIATVFAVYLIDNNVARPIPNYKTLEVMLVERGQSFEDIVEATEADFELYDLNFANHVTPIAGFNVRKAPDRSSEWTELIRFKSGYKPLAPFVRDPGDYIDPSMEDGYALEAYATQTEIEKLRERYEGKVVALNVQFRGPNEDGVDPNEIVDADLGGVRLMMHGYWKFVQITDPEGIKVLKYYNQYNGFGAVMDNDPIAALNALNKVNAITILQDNGIGSPVWNDFVHIAGVNVLDAEEYKNYFNDSNAADYFGIEYMQPFEPAGSSKYYTAAISSNMKQQMLDYFQSTIDDANAQQAFDAAVYNLGQDLQTLLNQYEQRKIDLISGAGGSQADEVVNAVSQIKTDLQRIFVTNKNINNGSSKANNMWKTKKRNSMRDIDENLFVVTRDLRIGLENATYNGYNSWRSNALNLFELPNLEGQTEVELSRQFVRDSLSDFSDGNLGKNFWTKVGLSVHPKDNEWLYQSIDNPITNNPTLFDREARDIYEAVAMNVPDIEAKIVEIQEDIIDLRDRVLFNWGEIPERNEIYTQEDLDNYLRELETYQAKLINRYGSVEEPVDLLYLLQNLGQRWIGAAYDAVQSMRQALNQKNGKWSIRWPNVAAEIVNNYLPYNEGEDYDTRFNNFRWNG